MPWSKEIKFLYNRVKKDFSFVLNTLFLKYMPVVTPKSSYLFRLLCCGMGMYTASPHRSGYAVLLHMYDNSYPLCSLIFSFN